MPKTSSKKSKVKDDSEKNNTIDLPSRSNLLRFLGTNFAASGLSILVISNARYLKSVVQAIEKTSSAKLKVTVHSSHDIGRIISTSRRAQVNVDFIVFLVDMRNSNAIQHLEHELRQIDRQFLILNRVCFASSNAAQYHDMVSLNDKLHSFAAKVDIPVIMGQLATQDGIAIFGEHVFNIATSFTGAISGVPLILSKNEQQLKWIYQAFS